MMKPDGMKLGIEAARLLAAADCCEMAPGLSEIEFQRIEQEYGIEFADDHRAFLASGSGSSAAQVGRS
ncbi:SMI1/KNR4 family protein [Nonomuraea sp. NPDC049714]|uniref:SMI1/KNR4 family protein n=1 Tax=Nonomuraea sp. NPDC049714 TaxID=3364357 RepID=UPI00379ED613